MTATHSESKKRFWLRQQAAASVPPDPSLELKQTLRFIGLATWVVMSSHAFLTPHSHLPLLPHLEVPWLLIILAFGVCLTLATYCPSTPNGKRYLLTLALIESALALLANEIINGNSVLAGLVLIVALQVGTVLPLSMSALWITGQSLGLLLIWLHTWKNADAVAFASGYLFLQTFVVLTAHTLRREICARKQLFTAIEELRVTRALLSEASRQAERLEISRELHDSVGHHLTALGMNLQVASHLTPASPARPYLLKAEEVAQQLLQDVRATVRGLRNTSSAGNFRQEVQRLSQAGPLQVQVTFEAEFSLSCPIHSHILLRTVQEILTNAARHAQAKQVWLKFRCAPGLLILEAFDDGRGVSHPKPGCGLTGMRERLESMNGTLTLLPSAHRGLGLYATLPVPRL